MSLVTNLISYYKLEADGTDSVGNNTLTGTSPTYTTGKIGNGGSFASASSQYLNGSNYTGSSSWSCNFWFNPTTNQDQTVVSKDDVATKRIFSFSFSATNVILYMWGTGQNFHQTTSAAHGMSTGTFYMWTGVWDAANNLVTLYKNGASFATFALAGNESADTTSNNLTLGRQNAASPIQYTAGKIDEVGNWSRALTSAEVTSLYNAGSGFQPALISVSETSTGTETYSAVKGQYVTATDTATETETYSIGSVATGWTNQSKSAVGSWTNLSKS